MISRWVLALPLLVLGADDPWTKVREVKGGTELRIYKKGFKIPIMAKMDEATETRLMIVIGESQVAIPKGEIDRIEQRPLLAGSRVTRENKNTKGVYESSAGEHGQPIVQGRTPSPARSASSSSVSIGSKPPFEPLYRRPLTNPKSE